MANNNMIIIGVVIGCLLGAYLLGYTPTEFITQVTGGEGEVSLVGNYKIEGCYLDEGLPVYEEITSGILQSVYLSGTDEGYIDFRVSMDWEANFTNIEEDTVSMNVFIELAQIDVYVDDSYLSTKDIVGKASLYDVGIKGSLNMSVVTSYFYDDAYVPEEMFIKYLDNLIVELEIPEGAIVDFELVFNYHVDFEGTSEQLFQDPVLIEAEINASNILSIGTEPVTDDGTAVMSSFEVITSGDSSLYVICGIIVIFSVFLGGYYFYKKNEKTVRSVKKRRR